jgi:phage FluMu gp28-like protein
MFAGDKYFLPYQREWLMDSSRLKLCQKSRQIGLSYAGVRSVFNEATGRAEEIVLALNRSAEC